MANAERTRREDGFTLIELLVMVSIIGILSAIAMPQYWKTVERNKTNEAVQFFDAVSAAEQRYYSKYNAYCVNAAGCAGFDLTMPPIHYFTAFTLANASTPPGWIATLTRTDAPTIYGNYTVSADVEQNGAPVLSCSQPDCATDLLPTALH